MVQVEERFMIQELFRSGVSISEIARRTGRDRKTVRAVINGPLIPATNKRLPKTRKIDPFVTYLERRIEHGVLNAEDTWPDETGHIWGVRLGQDQQALSQPSWRQKS